MAKSSYITWSAKKLANASQLNQQVRDNGNEIWKGSAGGDLDYYTSSITKDRIVIGTALKVFKVSGSTPSWGGYSGAQITLADIVLTSSAYRTDGVGTVVFDTNSYQDVTYSYKFDLPAGYAYFVTSTGTFVCNGYGGTLINSIYSDDDTYGDTKFWYASTIFDIDVSLSTIIKVTSANSTLRCSYTQSTAHDMTVTNRTMSVYRLT